MATQNFNLIQNGVHTLSLSEGGENLALTAAIIEDLVVFLRNKGVFNSASVVVAYTAPQSLSTIPAEEIQNG